MASLPYPEPPLWRAETLPGI